MRILINMKVAGTSEVKAQVKIKFNNIKGERMVCSRSVAVTLKKNSISQRTIDNSLMRYDAVTGEVSNLKFFFFILDQYQLLS